MTQDKQTGIYKITCTATGKVYIGSSINITKRWKSHQRELKNNKHKNRSLQEDYNKYGESYFNYTVIEICPPHALKLAEQIVLDKLLKLQSLSGKQIVYNYLTRTDGREALIERRDKGLT